MSEAITSTPQLDEKVVNFLTQEMDRLQVLYLDALSGAQNVFNFYLTFATAVAGALVVLLQLAPQTANDVLRTQLIVGGMLFFAALVGSVYLSALSGKYAHASRFARGVDELRRYLIANLQVPLPGVYDRFKDGNTQLPKKENSWWVWLLPTGTYAMFIAVLNSICLSGLVWIIGSSGGAAFGLKFAAGAVVFILALTIYNVYSRYTIALFVRRFHVRVDMGSELSIWAARV